MPIIKVNGGYRIANTPGISKTRKAAEERLRAIKANRTKKKK